MENVHILFKTYIQDKKKKHHAGDDDILEWWESNYLQYVELIFDNPATFEWNQPDV